MAEVLDDTERQRKLERLEFLRAKYGVTPSFLRESCRERLDRRPRQTARAVHDFMGPRGLPVKVGTHRRPPGHRNAYVVRWPTSPE